MVGPLTHDHARGRDGPSIDTGAPIPVTIDYVDAQLTELWRDVAEAAQVKGGVSAVTMAQVLNLIIKAESQAAANEYIGDIDDVTGCHPARVLLVIAEPYQEEMPVYAWASIHCQLPQAREQQVSSDRIMVAAVGHTVRQIPAAVIPLLLQ